VPRPTPTTRELKSHTNWWGIAKALFLDSSNKPRRLLSRWTRHCKWAGKIISNERLTILLRREDRDLAELSSLGHFLKGSSATLGLTKVKESCEKIQHYGQQKDEAGTTDEPDEDLCLSRIKAILVVVKEEYAEVEKVLKKFYATPAAS